MANEKQTGATATKRAPIAPTKTTVRSPRADAKTETLTATEPVTASLPVTEPVSTASATVAPARKVVAERVATESNAGIDMEAVRRRAYELYEQRGRLNGFHEQDWYTAIAELSGRKQSRSQNDRASGDAKRSTTKRNDSQRSA